MDMATLTTFYPVVKDLMERAPEVKRWVERKAKKEDTSFLLQIHLVQALDDLKQAFVDRRRYTLRTCIMGAMLSNPDLDSQRIKEKFLESGKVAQDIS